MSYEAERASIEGRLNDNWSTTAIAYENVDFDPPNDTAWVRLSILNGESRYRTVNNGKRHTGVISVQLFVPRNSGTNTARNYADTLAGIFDNSNFNGIICRTASIFTQSLEDEWLQLNINIPFWRDEL
jgi:hypothetical protein